MSKLLETVSRLEEAGGKLTLDGDRIRYSVPIEDAEARALLAELRKDRDKVRALLQERSVVPAMPPGGEIGAMGAEAIAGDPNALRRCHGCISIHFDDASGNESRSCWEVLAVRPSDRARAYGSAGTVRRHPATQWDRSQAPIDSRAEGNAA